MILTTTLPLALRIFLNTLVCEYVNSTFDYCDTTSRYKAQISLKTMTVFHFVTLHISSTLQLREVLVLYGSFMQQLI